MDRQPLGGAHGVHTTDPGAITALVADALAAAGPAFIHLAGAARGAAGSATKLPPIG